MCFLTQTETLYFKMNIRQPLQLSQRESFLTEFWEVLQTDPLFWRTAGVDLLRLQGVDAESSLEPRAEDEEEQEEESSGQSAALCPETRQQEGEPGWSSRRAPMERKIRAGEEEGKLEATE